MTVELSLAVFDRNNKQNGILRWKVAKSTTENLPELGVPGYARNSYQITETGNSRKSDGTEITTFLHVPGHFDLYAPLLQKEELNLLNYRVSREMLFERW